MFCSPLQPLAVSNSISVIAPVSIASILARRSSTMDDDGSPPTATSPTLIYFRDVAADGSGDAGDFTDRI